MHRRSLRFRLLICAFAIAQLLALPVSAVLDGQIVAADAELQSDAGPAGAIAVHVQPAHSANCAFCELLSSVNDLLPAQPRALAHVPPAVAPAVRASEPAGAPSFHPTRPRGPPTLLS